MEGNEMVTKVTTPFIMEFLGEVENMDQGAFPPPTPIKDGETVVGKISPYCQKLCALSAFYSREADRIEVELKYVPEEGKGALEALRSKAVEKKELASDLMYASVRTEFNLYEKCHLGIRKDWVVITKACDHSGTEGLIERLKKLGFGEL